MNLQRLFAPVGHRATGLLGLAALLLGLILMLGGGYLATLGGSWVYLVLGLSYVIAAPLLMRAHPAGILVLLAIALSTIVWAVIEADGNGWALIPRTGLPVLIAAIGIGLLPKLSNFRQWTAIAGAAGIVVLPFVIIAFQPGVAYHNGERIAALNKRVTSPVRADTLERDWNAYGGTYGSVRFSNLAMITPDNVHSLEVAWTFNTGDLPAEPDKSKYGSEVTPLKIDDTVYLCTPMNVVFALDPASGAQKWRFDPKVSSDYIPYTAACRGVSYYESKNTACKTRIIAPTLDGRILALDASTGVPCAGFGRNGVIDMKLGLGELEPGMVASTSPFTIINGVIVTNHQVKDNVDINAPSGVIRGYSAESGELLWAWDMNQPDLSGRPLENREYSRGTPNSWTISSGDPELGLVYVPMGNSAGDYVSYDRSDAELKYATALVALDVITGKPRWHFQTVHNDVWDYDLGSQASLIDYPTTNGLVAALILPTKQGDIYILDRRTGKSLHPVEERPVPQGGVEPWLRIASQPFSTFHTLAKSALEPRDMWGLTLLDQLYCRIKFHQAKYDGVFTPPTAKQPWIQYPGYNGGSDWGGVAVDPSRGVLVANYNDMPNYNQLLSKDHEISGSGGGEMGPMKGATFGIKVNAGMRNAATQLLCKEPPYGGIRAIDLATGDTIWDRPLGTARANGPWGIPSKMPFNIGTPNNGGAVLTGSGLIFVGAATDNLVRAIDINTGETVWQAVLPGGGQAGPITYEYQGRQYVVISAGGHHFMRTRISDAIIAYALPEA